MMNISSRLGNYQVRFDSLKKALLEIKKTHTHCVYIVDSKVWKLYRHTALVSLSKDRVFLLSAQEDKKSLDSVARIYDYLISISAKKNLVLVSIGGGIIQDVSGFAASTIYRGIRWIYIPTTLLAQADSCIGSKTSLNYKHYKNLIGTFYPPSEVWIDSGLSRTQIDKDYLSGIGEIVKLYIMDPKQSIEKIENRLEELLKKKAPSIQSSLMDCLKIKKKYIEVDELDKGVRNLLNYGHCFGHALESSSNFRIPHGQAVTAGMIIANLLSKNRGLLKDKSEQCLRTDILFKALQINIGKKDLRPEVILSAMKKDKKRVGKHLSVILLRENRSLVKADDVTDAQALNVLSEFWNLYRKHIHA